MTAYRRLCAAVAVSETGDWLLFIALPLYALHASGSALGTSAVFLVELVPAVVVGMLGAPVIDRRGPGRILPALCVAQALVLVPLLAVSPGRLWLVYAVAGAEAALTSITSPALQAVVPALVAPSELSRANTVVQMAASTARLAGSPLGGFLLPVLGLAPLVLADIASFLVSGALLTACRRSAPRPAPPAPGRLAGVAEGWRAVRRDRRLLCALAISGVAAVAQGLFLVLFVLFVLRSLHAGDGAVGLLRGVQAIGSLLGGLAVVRWARRAGTRALTAGGLAAFGLISLIVWNSPDVTRALGWYAGLFVVVGLPGTALVTGLVTGAQRASPPGVLGRVLSLLAVADALGQGAGILAAGVFSGVVSLGGLLDVQAGLYLGCAGVALIGFAAPRSRSHARRRAR